MQPSAGDCLAHAELDKQELRTISFPGETDNMCSTYALIFLSREHRDVFQRLLQIFSLPLYDVLGPVMHLRLSFVPPLRLLLLCSFEKLVAIRGRLLVSSV